MRLWEKTVSKVRQEVESIFIDIYTSLDFGAYINPENYFVSYIFKTNAELATATDNGLLEKINDYHKKCLLQNGYPLKGIKDCTFASQEDCDKEFNGNWYYYYK